jgi:hypothetical protein
MAGSGVDRSCAASSTSTRRQPETGGQAPWPRSGTRQVNAASVTSSHPVSTVRECPRSGIPLMSLMPWLALEFGIGPGVDGCRPGSARRDRCLCGAGEPVDPWCPRRGVQPEPVDDAKGVDKVTPSGKHDCAEGRGPPAGGPGRNVRPLCTSPQVRSASWSRSAPDPGTFTRLPSQRARNRVLSRQCPLREPPTSPACVTPTVPGCPDVAPPDVWPGMTAMMMTTREQLNRTVEYRTEASGAEGAEVRVVLRDAEGAEVATGAGRPAR